MRVPGNVTLDLEAVRRRLGTRAIGVDLEAALGRWRAGGHEGDETAFVDWVLGRQAEEQVMVTAILPPRLSGTPEPTVLAGATLILDEPGAVGDAAPPRDTGPAPVPAAAGRARYVILGEAGKGGMAVVHIARDLDLVRKVALKRLAGSAAAHQEAQARFLREVQISAQLDHPNIVPVYGLEVGPEGTPAYAMKLVEGQTLDEYLKETRACYARGELPDEAHALPTRLEHFLKVCDALAYAHDKGVVHRDLKPANVMIGRHHEIYVVDWGICRVMRLPESDPDEVVQIAEGLDGEADTRTRVGTVVGTARYMAPEQAQGRTELIGPATDQYALGLMLFEIVTLQQPYEGRTLAEVMARAVKGELRPVRHAFPSGDVPAELAAIVGRATALETGARYHDVRAFAGDIRRYLRGDAVEARPDTPWQKAQRYVVRHRQLVLMLLVSLVALASLGTAALLYRHERALVAAQAREQALLAFVDHVATRGDLLQTRLLELQGEVDVLASASALALQHAAPSEAAFYWIDDFDTPARQPPDLVDEGDRTVSPTHGAWIPAAGASRAQVAAQVRRLLQTRPYRNDLFERARRLFGDPEAETAAASVAGATIRGSGIAAFVVSLASGVTLHMPGYAGLARTIEPRETVWYRLATGQVGPQWGIPFAHTDDGGGLVVPLAQAIRGDDGRELGVTAILLALDRVIQNLLRDAPASGVRATLLLDPHGRVMASNGLVDPPRGSADGPLTLPDFPEPALHDALQQRDAGYVTTTAFGQRDIVAFDTIHPLEWVLVKVAAEDVVVARGGR